MIFEQVNWAKVTLKKKINTNIFPTLQNRFTQQPSSAGHITKKKKLRPILCKMGFDTTTKIWKGFKRKMLNKSME